MVTAKPASGPRRSRWARCWHGPTARWASSTSLLAFAAAAALAQQPRLVLDFDPPSAALGAAIDATVPLGDGVLFSRTEADAATALWFTDGTAAGTRVLRAGRRTFLRDLRGAVLDDGSAVFAFDGLADEGIGQELWLSNGTANGTQLIADLCPGSCDGLVPLNGGNRDFQTAANITYFLGQERDEEPRVFQYRPGEGISRVSGLEARGFALTTAPLPGPGNSSGQLPQGGEEPPPGPSGDELAILIYVSDAQGRGARLFLRRTETGTEADLATLGDRRLLAMVPFRAGALLVVAPLDGSPEELLYADSEGTALLAVGVAGEPPVLDHRFLRDESNSSRAFVRTEESGSCRVLATDGSAGGTATLAQFATSTCWREAVMFGSRVAFVEPTGAGGGRIYATTPSAVTVVVTTSESSAPSRLTSFGDDLYWVDEDSDGYRLLTSNGILLQTLRAFGQVDVSLFPRNPLGSVGEAMVFAAGESAGELDLWRSDGTAAGTFIAFDLPESSAGAPPSGLTATEQGLLFTLEGNSTANSLWLLEEGPTPSARRLADDRSPLAAVGPRLVAAISGQLQTGTQGEVVAIDLASGSETGLFPGAVSSVAAGRERLLVQLSAGAGFLTFFDGLWGTDGRARETSTLELLPPVQDIEARGTYPLIDTGGRGGDVLAQVPTESGTVDVYASSGDLDGTRLLANVSFEALSGSEAVGPVAFEPVLGASESVVFTFERNNPAGVLRVLSTSDGSRVRPADDQTPISLRDDPLFAELGSVEERTVLRDRLLFVRRNVNADEAVLFSTDGTKLGTQVLGRFSTIRGPLETARGLTFFAGATEEQGLELWRTDGSAEGTTSLGDQASGPAGSSPSDLRAVDGVLAFAQSVPDEGSELWISNGQTTGTREIVIEPGPAGSEPAQAVALENSVYFAATRSDVGREIFAVDRAALRAPCVASGTTLCLGEGRFAVEVDWLDHRSATRGRGTSVPFRQDSGRFWFFDPDNIELVVKILDARRFSDHWWVFYGALSDVSYWLTVTDTWSGEVRTYTNEQGDVCGVGDTKAFALNPEIDALVEAAEPLVVDSVTTTTAAECEGALCLAGGRFRATVEFQVEGEQPRVGVAVPGNDTTGYFWFFSEENIELAVKVIDGRVVNGNWWVYYGALSDVQYTLRVEDTETGLVQEYVNEAGSLCGSQDVDSFVEP